MFPWYPMRVLDEKRGWVNRSSGMSKDNIYSSVGLLTVLLHSMVHIYERVNYRTFKWYGMNQDLQFVLVSYGDHSEPFIKQIPTIGPM